jgi:large subunit ribosomal protein L6
MSRIGKKPVSIPSGVKVRHDAAQRTIAIEGPKGKMQYQYVPDVAVALDEAAKEISCAIAETKMDDGPTKALWGTTRARIAGMIEGVTKGYTRKLEVVGVGWSAKLQGRTLQLNVGYSQPAMLAVPEGVAVTIEGAIITLTGYDSQAVGQFAAEIRSKRPPEPYNGKGIKYTDEHIIRKQGKAFGA